MLEINKSTNHSNEYWYIGSIDGSPAKQKYNN